MQCGLALLLQNAFSAVDDPSKASVGGQIIQVVIVFLGWLWSITRSDGIGIAVLLLARFLGTICFHSFSQALDMPKLAWSHCLGLPHPEVNQRCTGEQSLKAGKHALRWTRARGTENGLEK
jgi:hypothetical protein